IYHFQQGSPIRQVIFVPLVEAALRYGITGALALTVASAPVIATFEWLRQRRFPPHTYHVNYVTLQIGLEAMMALIVGWLFVRLRREGNIAETRAAEAERLRDQLGRRADVLEAANRCARALSSSLELEQAFDAFIREVRGLVPFDRVAIELTGLLGRLVASAVQNIRAYEAERRTVEELRRLSALRADFVSLVSHELRTPMAAVIGSARTLQQRWRELTATQRESFLDLIAGETGRLATLIGDVLDTSRIEAGTFSFRFGDVDLGDLVRDS